MGEVKGEGRWEKVERIPLDEFMFLYEKGELSYGMGKRQRFGKAHMAGFPGGAVVENPPANAGDTGSSPGPGRSHMLRSN